VTLGIPIGLHVGMIWWAPVIDLQPINLLSCFAIFQEIKCKAIGRSIWRVTPCWDRLPTFWPRTNENQKLILMVEPNRIYQTQKDRSSRCVEVSLKLYFPKFKYNMRNILQSITIFNSKYPINNKIDILLSQEANQFI